MLLDVCNHITFGGSVSTGKLRPKFVKKAKKFLYIVIIYHRAVIFSKCFDPAIEDQSSNLLEVER